VFALSSVQFATGWCADLADWGRFCTERGICFVVDAIQSLGQVPIDVRAAQVDILATGGQKWLCSPFGTGFAYVRRELVRRLEPDVVGWTAMRGAGDLTDQCGYRYDLLESARRFEVSTQPWHDFAGFAHAVELLLEVGVERIRRHVLGLIDPLADWLRETGAGEIVSDLRPARRSGIFAFRPADAAGAHRALERAGVGCVLREGSVRLSPHLYNTPDDVRAAMDVLARPEAW
jgi:cysteine desulfurase/selenocysteine lyase